MAYTIKTVEVWAADIVNKPGTLARVLEALAAAGAELEFLIARQAAEHTSRIFLAPVKGKKQQQAARVVGLSPAAGMHSIRIDGPDRKGLGAEITRAVAAAGVNIRGASAATVGNKNVFYLGFKTEDEAKKAAGAVKKALAGGKRK